MQSPNYFFGIVKILENPKQKIFDNNRITTECRALIPQIRKKKVPSIILLVFWGNLARDVTNYYQINDYILVEGYVSIKKNKSKEIDIRGSNLKKVLITVLKVYPFLLKSRNAKNKV